MASPREIATLLIAVTIAMTVFAPLATSVTDGTGVQTVENETVTADVGNYTQLDNFRLVEDSETVYNSTGVEVTSGTDYEMNYSDGSIKALSGGSISDGSDINVTYDWRATTQSTTTIIKLIPLFLGLLVLGRLAFTVSDMA